MFHSKTPLAAVIAALMLASCGSDNGTNTVEAPVNDTPDTETPTQTDDNTGGDAPITINAVSFKQTSTGMGYTYSVDGEVSVLLSSSGELSVQVLDKTDFSLYTFDNDAVDESACTTDGCITNWPPLLAGADAEATEPMSLVDRTDGYRQWALRGKPLYFFAGDTEALAVNGQGVGGVWRTAVDEPVTWNRSEDNDADGVYLTSAGKVWTTQRDSTSAFSVVEQTTVGMSLYTFDVDEKGSASCNNACLDNWPALLAAEGDTASAPYSLIERTIGDTTAAKQWALYGKPLYFYAGDNSAGDTNGKDLNNWRLARPVPTRWAESERGTILTAAGLALAAAPVDNVETTTSAPKDGYALYTFDNDTDAGSQCTGGCLSNWPALMAAEGAEPYGAYTLVMRDSGEYQWALNGEPLYFFAGDTQAGDINGDEAGGVWHLARPVPVTADSHDTAGVIFTAHGTLLNKTGEEDNSLLGHSLYIFEEDTDGVSTCYGGCEGVWPPLFASATANDFGYFTVVRRDDPNTAGVDEVFQWAYKNQPLYFVNTDTTPGDINGVYGTWKLATP